MCSMSYRLLTHDEKKQIRAIQLAGWTQSTSISIDAENSARYLFQKSKRLFVLYHLLIAICCVLNMKMMFVWLSLFVQVLFVSFLSIFFVAFLDRAYRPFCIGMRDVCIYIRNWLSVSLANRWNKTLILLMRNGVLVYRDQLKYLN